MNPKTLFLFAFYLLSVIRAQNTYAQNGMVVCDHKIASQIGVDILKQGGNAIDASVATALALAVTFPQAGNIGGGGFMVYMDSSTHSTTIDFREKAPLAAHPEMFLDDSGNLIPGSNHKGLKSVGVPGTIAGLYYAHQKYGKLPWELLVQPAVDLAAKGFPLSYALHQHALKFQKDSTAPLFMRQFFNSERGLICSFQELWKQPALARTLELIRDHGHNGFYQGPVAQKLADYMAENGGLITQEDLLQYQAIERPSLKGSYKGYDLHTMPPPSSGGVALIEMMNLMELARFDTLPFGSAPFLHFLAESMRRTFADRAAFLGDPEFNENMPVDRLTSKAFAQMRYDHIDFQQASKSDSSRFGQIYDGHNTTHISVLDGAGNAVSLTYTLERSYGAQLGAPELGFILNNEMGDFNPQPGYTNSGWLIGTPANVIAPGKRMLSSMSPTIVSKNGKIFMVIGSPGGRTIINTVFQTVLNVLEFNMGMDEAIEALKIHHQWFPDRIQYESNLMAPETKAALEAKGHKVQGRSYLGRLMGIILDPETGVMSGGADSSSADGGAVGY